MTPDGRLIRYQHKVCQLLSERLSWVNAFEDDVVEAKRLLTDLFVLSPLVTDKTDFLVGVESFGEYGVNLLARVWVPTENILAT